jgi:N-acyl-D-aspartate/D-glutamate deacylase
MLTHWARDRSRGEGLALEEVVRLQTSDTASLIGLTDRGTIAPGKRADLNVIDFDHLALHGPTMVHDLPAGGRRFIQNATGYCATIVAGQVVFEDGKPSGALPGRLLRRSHLQTRPTPSGAS